MSLIDALFEEAPAPLLQGKPISDVWISSRTDASGTGSEDDPFSGATRQLPPVQVVSFSSTGTNLREAILTTASGLGLVDGDVVQVSGVSGAAAAFWNGKFPVYNTSGNAFRFWMKRNGTVVYNPPDVPLPNPGDQISVSKAMFMFDVVMRKLAALSNTYMRIHIGSGTFETRGYSDSTLGTGRTIWQPTTGMKIMGSGIDVTILKLVFADVQDGNYYAISSVSYGYYSDYAEVSAMTVDSALPTQPISPPYAPQGKPGRDYASVACSAVSLQGAFCRIKNVKAINWGTQCGTEAFVLATSGGHPDFPNNVIINPIIEDCVCVQPNENNRYTATIIHSGGGADPGGLRHIYTRGAVLRRNFVDSIFSGGHSCFTLVVSSATVVAGTQNRVWIITTPRPHNRATGNRVLISDVSAVPPGTVSLWNQYQYFEIEDLNPVDPYKFKVTFPDSLGSQVPPSDHYLVLGSTYQALSGGGCEGCIFDDNVVLNSTYGGPYIDSYNIKEFIIRRNHYRNVTIGPFITNAHLSPGPRDVTLVPLNPSDPSSKTVLATSPGHGFYLNETIKIRGTSDTRYTIGATWTITAVSQDTFQFEFSSANPPSDAGFAVDLSYDLISLTYVSGGFAQGTTFVKHTLSIGDRIKISKSVF